MKMRSFFHIKGQGLTALIRLADLGAWPEVSASSEFSPKALEPAALHALPDERLDRPEPRLRGRFLALLAICLLTHLGLLAGC